MTTPGTWNFDIYQGAKFARTITYPDRNMTTGTFAMHIREAVFSATTLLELTTANGRITTALVGTDTAITLEIDATVTDDLSFGSAAYDLEYIPASGAADTERILQGRVTLSKEVTRTA